MGMLWHRKQVAIVSLIFSLFVLCFSTLCFARALPVSGVSSSSSSAPQQEKLINASVLPVLNASLPPPFGANLFVGGYDASSLNGVNDRYQIAVGDKIAMWLWGAITLKEVVVVDGQGNIFLPDVGPISVIGVAAGRLNALVKRHIKRIYTQDVDVYVNVLTATPVSVFVTGPVVRPGQYAGLASDSVLSYLNRAGGIDADRGSYRHIRIKRHGRVVANYDLYDFLEQGVLLRHQFKDRDVIVVAPQGSTVVVEQGARNPFRFEFAHSHARGTELIRYARPLPSVSHVGVKGNRLSGPISMYLTAHEFADVSLQDGDSIVFEEDLHPQTMDIRLQGEYLGQSLYTLKKGTYLHDFLNHIEVDPSAANYRAIYLKRQSVARQQKDMLRQSLDRLERSIYTTPASSDGEAIIRTKEATLVSEFIQRARAMQPDGKVIVSDQGHIANIRLEPNDIVVIPKCSDVVNVGGEVLMPQAVVYNPQATITDYVAWAGGFSRRGNAKKIAVVQANGMVSFDPKAQIQAGDHILVMPYVDSKNMQFAKDMTQIVYQVAVAANVIF